MGIFYVLKKAGSFFFHSSMPFKTQKSEKDVIFDDEYEEKDSRVIEKNMIAHIMIYAIMLFIFSIFCIVSQPSSPVTSFHFLILSFYFAFKLYIVLRDYFSFVDSKEGE